MESGIDVKALDRFFKLIASVVTLVTIGKRNIGKVCEALQEIVSESQKSYELYIAPGQHSRAIFGFGLSKHLQLIGLMGRCPSLENELVKSWIANPSTYPELLKEKNVFLWGHVVISGDAHRVACLVWYKGTERVEVRWRNLKYEWSAESPALILPTSSSRS